MADGLALLIASIMIGVAVTASMTEIGSSWWVVQAAATFAYSGTGELAYASVIGSGGGTVAALTAAMLVSARFGLLAMSMKGRWPAWLLERIGIAHTASEPAVAAVIAAGEDRVAARRSYWALVLWMNGGWIAGTALGLVLGNVVGDTRVIGLDVVFPASFVGAVVSSLRRQDSALAALGGAAVALSLTPLLPAGLPLLAAAGAGVVALRLPAEPLRPRSRRSAE